MDILLIEELLQTVCTQEASDLHLAVGSQPVMHLHGQGYPLATNVLDAADTLSFMKYLTPQRCQNELQEVGRTDFGFAFGELAQLPRRGLQGYAVTSSDWCCNASPKRSRRTRSVVRHETDRNAVRCQGGWFIHVPLMRSGQGSLAGTLCSVHVPQCAAEPHVRKLPYRT